MAQISPKMLIPESFQVSRDDITGQLGLIWELIKAPLIDRSSTETRCIPLLNHVADALHGAGLHGNCHCSC